MSTTISLGKLVAQIQGDNSSLVKSVEQSQQIANNFSSNVENGFGRLKEYNTSFNRAFISGLEKGNASLGSFGSMLLNTADNAELNAGQIADMAAATGVYSKEQIAAGKATANVALKSVELSRAVADGKLSAEVAGAQWRQYAEEQGVAGKNTRFNKEQIMGMVTNLGVLTATLGTVAVAGKKAWEFTKAGAGLQLANRQFVNLAENAGYASGVLLSDMRRATDGMVTDAQLIETATSIISLGLVA